METDSKSVDFTLEPLGGEPTGESNSLLSFVEAEMDEAYDDELEQDLFDSSPVGIQKGIRENLLKSLKMDPRTMAHEMTNQKITEIAKFMQEDLGLTDPTNTIHAIIKLAGVSKIAGPNPDHILEGIHNYVRSTWEMKRFKEDRNRETIRWGLDPQM